MKYLNIVLIIKEEEKQTKKSSKSNKWENMREKSWKGSSVSYESKYSR